MSALLRLLLQLQIFSPALRPLVRLIVGFVAIPLFRRFATRVIRTDELDRELAKDLEQWFRGALLLLMASKNMEDALFGWTKLDFDGEYGWISASLRVMLAVGVIEAMPDQELFAIIHPGPSLLLPKGRIFQALREQWWDFCKGLFWRHLDRSSAVFAIVTALKEGWGGWVCYGLAITQYLIIGLISSRDKAVDALDEFDRLMTLRRERLFPAETHHAATSIQAPPAGEATSGLPNPPP
jgi:hypothetical protein